MKNYGYIGLLCILWGVQCGAMQDIPNNTSQVLQLIQNRKFNEAETLINRLGVAATVVPFDIDGLQEAADSLEREADSDEDRAVKALIQLLDLHRIPQQQRMDTATPPVVTFTMASVSTTGSLATASFTAHSDASTQSSTSSSSSEQVSTICSNLTRGVARGAGWMIALVKQLLCRKNHSHSE